MNDGESEKIDSVSVEEAAVLEPSMNKGALKIDFTKDNGSVADSVTVDNSDKQGISLEKGEYTVQVTTVGVTTGNVIDQ